MLQGLVGDQISVSCNSGYAGGATGEAVVTWTCADPSGQWIAAPCLDIDDCAVDPAGCVAGSCTDTGANAYTCECNSGFFFDAGTCTDIDDCANFPCGGTGRGSCTDTGTDSYTCECSSGFFFDAGTCADIDDCAGDPCDAGLGSCTDAGANNYSCDCSTGYTFGSGTCEEIMPCLADELNDCDANASCNHEGPGGHSCTCTSGYSCSGCSDSAGVPGLHSCTCNSGSVGTSCELADPCSTTPCFVNSVAAATCVSVAGTGLGNGFVCTCPSGFTGDGVGVDGCVAVPIDPCAGDPSG